MLGDEEKKAIELIKKQIDFCKNNTECREELNQCFGCTIEVEDVNALEIILNLIEKQEKEIEALKYSIIKATKIIEEYTNETENSIKKLIEYQENYIDGEMG